LASTTLVGVPARPVAAGGAAGRVIGAGRAEGPKLARNFYAALRVGVDDHPQRAVEAMALLQGEVV
jgi:hypothetical protein